MTLTETLNVYMQALGTEQLGDDEPVEALGRDMPILFHYFLTLAREPLPDEGRRTDVFLRTLPDTLFERLSSAAAEVMGAVEIEDDELRGPEFLVLTIYLVRAEMGATPSDVRDTTMAKLELKLAALVELEKERRAGIARRTAPYTILRMQKRA
ncbi:MAG TPA: hypothetical protein VJ810_19285 [Blastocatellia bacterium]|nr:hypothetical protein [Blastocatellia bacterium]